MPEAQLAVAVAGYNTGLTDIEIVAASTRAVDRALELRPGWERGVLVKADMLAKGSPDSAIDYLKAFLAQRRLRAPPQARSRSSISSRSAMPTRERCFSASSTPILPTASSNTPLPRFRCR